MSAAFRRDGGRRHPGAALGAAPKRIDLSLDRIERLLAALDHPEQKLPPLIHVAGTNGKGSTIAFMRAILEAAGQRVHVYTSPNLVRLNERFRIGREGGGKFVDDAALADALAECEAKNGDAPITVFEIETVAAFLLFSRHPADILLLEVGLGGRLDATNVVERPLASVITPVSVDHRDFLGDTIEQIAAEKAGILKHDVPAVIASQVREALAVIERQAGRMKAPLSVAGENWTATEERGRLVYQDNDGLLDLPAPKLYGRHQFENAGAAIAALRVAGLKLPVAAFEAGMTRVEWPARMQRLAHGRLAALLPPESELWLDGGHNADGGRAVAGRWPISRNACRGRWCSWSACCRPRTAKVFCAISPAWRAASSPCRSIRTRRCRPRRSPASRRPSAFRRLPATLWRAR